jgi:hypothetical protein
VSFRAPDGGLPYPSLSAEARSKRLALLQRDVDGLNRLVRDDGVRCELGRDTLKKDCSSTRD